MLIANINYVYYRITAFNVARRLSRGLQPGPLWSRLGLRQRAPSPSHPALPPVCPADTVGTRLSEPIAN